MQEKFFNLIDEPWLPVELIDGTRKELGLAELFNRASEIRVLTEPCAPSLLAQYRLLLAILHRAVTFDAPNWTEGERRNWFFEFPQEAISRYLQQHYDRFWLFHPIHPFLQVADLARAKALQPKSWTVVDLSAASGNAAVIFDHHIDSLRVAISPAQAVRKLVGYLQCVPGGLVKAFRGSDTAGPLANAVAVMPIGVNLQQSLVLALHPNLKNKDLPSWERDPLTVNELTLGGGTLATGPNDRYSRQSRSVLFLLNQNKTISELLFAEGDSLNEDPQAPDSMVSFRPSTTGMARLTFSEGRAFWRDLPSLLPDGINSIPAKTIESSLVLSDSLGISQLTYLVAGVSSDKASLKFFREELVTLPSSVFINQEVIREIREMLRLAEEVSRDLRDYAAEFITLLGKGNATKDSLANARVAYDKSPIPGIFFSRLERVFWLMLPSIDKDPDENWTKWQVQLRKTVDQSWRRLIQISGSNANTWSAAAQIESKLYALLKHKLQDKKEDN